MRKGYSREEALAFLPKLASAEIPNDRIPEKAKKSPGEEAGDR
jgi:hypothetical protein